MRALAHLAVVTLALAPLTGCLGTGDASEAPGLLGALGFVAGEVDLEGALAILEGTACSEIQVRIPVNETAALEPPPTRGDAEPWVTLRAVRCEALGLGGSPATATTLVTFGVPLIHEDEFEGVAERIERVLVDDAALAQGLAAAGLPAEHAPGLSLEDRRSSGISRSVVVTLAGGPHAFDLEGTVVSLDLELPFGGNTAVATRGLAEGEEGARLLVRAVNVTGLGGVSAELSVRSGSTLHRLVGELSSPGSGAHARHDLLAVVRLVG